VLRQSAYGDLYPVGMLMFSADELHVFAGAHSERNAAEIHCLRRLGVRDMNTSFLHEYSEYLVGVSSQLSEVVQASGKNMWAEAYDQPFENLYVSVNRICYNWQIIHSHCSSGDSRHA